MQLSIILQLLVPTVQFVTLVAGIVTIIWFVRDVRKENSKILKSVLEVQQKIEEGQRQGFGTLAQILERISQSSERTAEILERIANKLG